MMREDTLGADIFHAGGDADVVVLSRTRVGRISTVLRGVLPTALSSPTVPTSHDETRANE